MMSRDYSISAIRLLATMAIVCSHIAMLHGSELYFWFNLGVQLFVLISAELFARQNIQHPLTWLGHRFASILVPYHAYLAIAFLLGRLCGQPPNLCGVVRYLTATQGIGFASASFAPQHSLGHLWFITYILLAYVMTPLLQWADRKVKAESPWRKNILLICIFCVLLTTAANRLLGWQVLHSSFLSLYVYGYVSFRNSSYPFAETRLPISIAHLLFCALGRGVLRYLLLNSAQFLTATGAHFAATVAYNTLDFMTGIFLYLLLRRLTSSGTLSRFKRMWDFSDRCSYGIYLTHMLAIILSFWVASDCHWLVQGTCSLAIAIALGWMFHYMTGPLVAHIRG